MMNGKNKVTSGLRTKRSGRVLLAAALAAMAVVLAAAALVLSGCDDGVSKGPFEQSDEYENTAGTRANVTYAVDDLGRKLLTAKSVKSEREGKYVGIFYFLWEGEHGTDGPYDNSITEKGMGALYSESGWMSAGGGPVHAHHHWGKPLFDYYVSADRWVTRKHIQMLTDAGVDFVVFDTTNGVTYTDNALAFMKIAHEYNQAGFKAPKVVFYTNTRSGETMEKIYRKIYNKFPELEDTWFYWDGKPLIIGDRTDAGFSDEASAFFRVKASQWPTDDKKDDGFPWMEFTRLLQDYAVYGVNGRREIVNVSVAQHCDTIRFSATAWYGGNDHTRSWHNGKIDTSPDAYKYGYNIAEQYEWALKMDPEIVFITGWNEWVAQRQPSTNGEPIVFVDCANLEASRDIEPMEGGYFDNYYMQMISFIRKFKGMTADTSATKKTIDIGSGFAQWNDVKSCYVDYENDTVDRNSILFGDVIVEDTSGENDIVEMKVCEDAKSVYFFVKTADAVTSPSDDDWMRLYIGTSGKGRGGYDFCVNYKMPDQDGKLYIAKITAGTEDFTFKDIGEVEYRVLDNMMMVKVPKSKLSIKGNANIIFKWADNCGDNIEGFYTKGDAAPIGRAGFVYGNK